MKYINNSTEGVVVPIKRNIADEISSVSWIKLHPGETEEIPESAIKAAEAAGLTKVSEEPKAKEVPVEAEESEIGETKVETKKIKKKDKIDELSNIKGIGLETVDDIKRIYSNIESLKEALINDSVPLRNDICIKLKKYFEVN